MKVVILISMDTRRQLRKLPVRVQKRIMEMLNKEVPFKFQYMHSIKKGDAESLLEIVRKNVEAANAILGKIPYPELGVRYLEKSGRIIIFFRYLLR